MSTLLATPSITVVKWSPGCRAGWTVRSTWYVVARAFPSAITARPARRCSATVVAYWSFTVAVRLPRVRKAAKSTISTVLRPSTLSREIGMSVSSSFQVNRAVARFGYLTNKAKRKSRLSFRHRRLMPWEGNHHPINRISSKSTRAGWVERGKEQGPHNLITHIFTVIVSIPSAVRRHK